MFCVHEAYDWNCHAPCHTAETTTADNTEKMGTETAPRHTIHTKKSTIMK